MFGKQGKFGLDTRRGFYGGFGYVPSGGGAEPEPVGYAVTWEGSNSNISAASAASMNAPYPEPVADGELLVLIVGQKPSSANAGSVDTPSGWTVLDSLTGAGGYDTTLGSNTGNTNIFAFTKEADGTETGNLSVALNTNNVAWAVIHRLSKAGGEWLTESATGEDSTIGDFVVNFTSDPGVKADDFAIAAMVIPTGENLGAHFQSPVFTQSGVTFGAVTEVGEFLASGGNKVAGASWRAAVTAGESAGNPTYTGNEAFSTNNGRGAAIFIRIRAEG
jgi:MSHA biogenesis protein MshQ